MDEAYFRNLLEELMEAGNCRKTPGSQATLEITLGSDLQNLLKFCVVTEANNIYLFFFFFLDT